MKFGALGVFVCIVVTHPSVGWDVDRSYLSGSSSTYSSIRRYGGETRLALLNHPPPEARVAYPLATVPSPKRLCFFGVYLSMYEA